jgi:hypothetical protein
VAAAVVTRTQRDSGEVNAAVALKAARHTKNDTKTRNARAAGRQAHRKWRETTTPARKKYPPTNNETTHEREQQQQQQTTTANNHHHQ